MARKYLFLDSMDIFPALVTDTILNYGKTETAKSLARKYSINVSYMYSLIKRLKKQGIAFPKTRARTALADVLRELRATRPELFTQTRRVPVTTTSEYLRAEE